MELLGYINTVLDKYSFQNIYDNKIAIRVPTVIDYVVLEDLICKYCKDNNLKVPKLTFLTSSNYIKQNKTCINIGPVASENFYSDEYDVDMNYCDEDYYIDQGYKIIDIKDCNILSEVKQLRICGESSVEYKRFRHACTKPNKDTCCCFCDIRKDCDHECSPSIENRRNNASICSLYVLDI